MEGLGDFGLLVNKVGQDNVYQNLLASIDRENLSGSSITVAVVHALSKKVFLAKNKRRDKAPTTMLSKKQFAHVLVYICNRFAIITEISLKNGVWGPVEWVGDQLTGWGGPPRTKNSKINGLCFLKFFN